jgi:FtsH-binding integral membrane protein
MRPIITRRRASLICSVLGLVVFAGLTLSGFRRLRRSADLGSAPLIAARSFLAR